MEKLLSFFTKRHTPRNATPILTLEEAKTVLQEKISQLEAIYNDYDKNKLSRVHTPGGKKLKNLNFSIWLNKNQISIGFVCEKSGFSLIRDHEELVRSLGAYETTSLYRTAIGMIEMYGEKILQETLKLSNRSHRSEIAQILRLV